jgi:hypothetical protein
MTVSTLFLVWSSGKTISIAVLVALRVLGSELMFLGAWTQQAMCPSGFLELMSQGNAE